MIILETWLAAVMGLIFFGLLIFFLLVLIAKDLKEEKLYERIGELEIEKERLERYIGRQSVKTVLKENGDE
ncbi:MAG: hypothetical protein Q4B40_07525 [Clostridia bacterium]|nr:hypothetical protein [Clostridia bacterium]